MSKAVKITSVKTVLHDRRTDTLDVFTGVLVITTDDSIEGQLRADISELAGSFYIDGDGLLHVPDGPGLGIDIDIDWHLINSSPAGIVE